MALSGLGANQQASNVVVPTGFFGGFHEARRKHTKGKILRQEGLDARVGKLASQAIGTQQEQVTGFRLKFENVRGDLALGSKCPGNDVSKRRAKCLSLSIQS